jgi:hypothetical protein
MATETSSGCWAKASGRRIYGDWPGLATAQLYQGRDLAVTTDYRTALAVILERHLRLIDHQLTEIFPGLPPAGPTWGRCWWLDGSGKQTGAQLSLQSVRQLGLRRSVQPPADPRRWLILTHLKYTAHGLGLRPDAPPCDERAGEHCIGEVDRHRVVEHAPHP